MKRSGLSGKPCISNMKRKTTISPSNKNKVEINQEPFSKKFSQGGIKVAEVNSNKFKNGIKIKHKTSQERKTNHIGEPLSILKEESELEETKNQSNKQISQNKSKSKGKYCNETCNVEPLNIHKVQPQTRDVIRLSRSSCFDGVYDSLGSNKPIKSTKITLDPIKPKIKNPKEEEDPYGDKEFYKSKVPNVIDNNQALKTPKIKNADQLRKMNFNKTEKLKLGTKLAGFKNLNNKKIISVEKASLKTHAEKKQNKDNEGTPVSVSDNKETPSKNSDSKEEKLSAQRINSKATSRYQESGEKSERKLNKDIDNVFNGFQDNDEIIINPEFNKSLKESLKQSKRRLMLFIDHNEDLNPIDEKPKFIKAISNNSDTSKSMKSSFRKKKAEKKSILDNKKMSLGLKNEDSEYSSEGEEDLCLCEIEPYSKIFYPVD